MTSNETRVQTLMSKYGVINVGQLAEVQEKRRKTFEDKRTTLIYYQEPRVNKIDASELNLYKLDKKIADDWLDKYHPFKAPKGNVLSLGLVKGDMIYAIMTFKKSRNSKYVAELSRLGMLPTYNVVNGYDKLSKFASELGLYNIIAYVNLSFENVQDYESIGMKYIRDIQRTKWWIRKDQKISDASRRQKHLSDNEMVFQGYIPVYDCGIRVYVFS